MIVMRNKHCLFKTDKNENKIVALSGQNDRRYDINT